MLVVDDARLERLHLRLGAVGPRRQRTEPVEERLLVRRVDLEGRRRNRRIVERAHGHLEPAVIFAGHRRAAIGPKAATGLVGAGEAPRRAAGPFEVRRGDQRGEERPERLLAQAAVADRRAAELRDAEAHRAALTTAGLEGRGHRAISQVVPSFESLSTTPIAASSSRMRSDSLKSFALRAAVRASISDCTLAASTVADRWWRAAHCAALSCRKPSRRSDAARSVRALSSPVSAMLRKPCSTAIACGVLRSSPSASLTAPDSAPPGASATIQYQSSRVFQLSSSPFTVQSIGCR